MPGPDKKDPWMPEIDPTKIPPPDEIERRNKIEREKRKSPEDPGIRIDLPPNESPVPPKPTEKPTKDSSQRWVV